MDLDAESSVAKLTLDKPRMMTLSKDQGKSTSLRLSGSALWLPSCISLTAILFIYSNMYQLRTTVEENSYQSINQVVI